MHGVTHRRQDRRVIVDEADADRNVQTARVRDQSALLGRRA
jgi:hypothetical protein